MINPHTFQQILLLLRESFIIIMKSLIIIIIIIKHKYEFLKNKNKRIQI